MLLPDRGWRCLGRVIAFCIFCINMYVCNWLQLCDLKRVTNQDLSGMRRTARQFLKGLMGLEREIAPKEFLECHEQIFVAAWHQGFVDFKSHWMGRGFRNLSHWMAEVQWPGHQVLRSVQETVFTKSCGNVTHEKIHNPAYQYLLFVSMSWRKFNTNSNIGHAVYGVACWFAAMMALIE